MWNTDRVVRSLCLVGLKVGALLPAAPEVMRMFSTLIGTELGGLTIVEELATGGMGTVFLARRSGQATFGQPVAVKVIHPHLAQDRGFVEMFVDEARIASCVRHPNVCAVLEFGKARGTFYLAMEYLQGETWAATLRALRQSDHGSTLSLLLAHVVAQACEGLHAAHEAIDQRGLPLCIVHRDVSPQNLFVGYDGGVRLLDFGIASAADRLHTTRFGTTKGRYAYMAPEQMLGEAVDRRSDVWSLGVVLREGLTGRSVFRGATDAETVYAVTHRLVPQWELGVHPELQRITDKAMQWEPERRYQSARELGMDLARFSLAAHTQLGMAELSVRMHALFPERIAQTRALLRRAAHDDLFPSRIPFSLPPPAALQDERTTQVLRASGRRRLPLHASETAQPLLSTRCVGEGAGSRMAAVDDPDSELYVPTCERFDPAAETDTEAPTWERDLAPTRDHGRRPATTHELMTVSRPAAAREAVAGSAWVGVAVAAACAALLVLGTQSLEPTRVVLTGSVRLPSSATSHATSGQRRRSSGSEPSIEAKAEPARLPALQFNGAAAASSEQSLTKADALSAPPAVSAPRELSRARRASSVRGRRTVSPRLQRASTTLPAVRPVPEVASAATEVLDRPGMLNIMALNGWADVYLGTRKLGTTPGRFELPAGIHTLTLRVAGRVTGQREVVEIRAGEVSRARIRLNL